MLFFDADGSVERWVAGQLGADSFGPARAIGITLDKKFLGGVVYHRLANENVEMSIADNAAAIEMNERLGFTCEGTLREYNDGKDTDIFGMLVQDCKWIK